MHKTIVSKLEFLIFLSLALGTTMAFALNVSPTAEEKRLYELVNAYRAENGLPAIPFSNSLTYVAQTHVKDLQNHPPSGTCNMHSWSSNGAWSSCCYTSDHAQAQCMWDKPRELTPYPGNGYENAYGGSSGYIATAQGALAGWKNSSGHNAVILNQNTWNNVTWQALGVGIYQSYAVLWFGKEVDPIGAPNNSTTQDGQATGGTIPTVQEGLTWQTSKANAISLAQRDGKLILLVAGRDTCGNTNHTRDTLVKTTSPPINTLLQERFVLWYANVDSSSEYSAYSQGLGSYTLPLIATIDPNDSDNYLDRTTNVQEPNAFYARLEQLTQAPLAKFTVSQQQGQVPLSITLDASDSLDRDGSIVDYRWTFGDGQGTNGPIVSAQHTFVTAGTYSVTLIVTDNAGLTHRAFKTITVTDQNHQNQVDDTVNDSSAGGCTLGKGDATFDPLFPFMLIMSLWYWYRRRSSVIK
ncbi:MAG: PKD domain-containing protein [Candidatus Parabeggiatoa sp.]|nr:PKD domain-containing protein [Candidatus Parabeggiatoa sp.]